MMSYSLTGGSDILEEYAKCTNISEEAAASLVGAEEYFSILKAVVVSQVRC